MVNVSDLFAFPGRLSNTCLTQWCATPVGGGPFAVRYTGTQGLRLGYEPGVTCRSVDTVAGLSKLTRTT